MVSKYFGDLFDSAESGTVAASIPKGTYDVVVTGARPRAESSLIFLTLQVLNGPAQGKETDVSLYFPKEGDARGARVFFVKKINAFSAYPDVKAAFQAADGAPDLESGLSHIADALIGKQVVADIKLQTEGDYAGNNELAATRPLQGVVQAAPAPVQAAPAGFAEANGQPMVAAPAPAEAPAAPF